VENPLSFGLDGELLFVDLSKLKLTNATQKPRFLLLDYSAAQTVSA
jgi:hypothetical protein